MTQLGMFDGSGPARARQGMDQVLNHQLPDRWLDLTFANVVQFLRTHAEYCADDLYRFSLAPYPPHHPNAIGALTRRLIETGYLERVGSVKSRRTQAQARRIVVYRSRIFARRVDYDPLPRNVTNSANEEVDNAANW
jgi:hypothetical protein